MIEKLPFETKTVTGELFNLSFDGKKRVVGWVLLVTPDGKEYILRENSLITGFGQLKLRREVYTCDQSLRELTLSESEVEKVKKKRIEYSGGIGIGIALSAFSRRVIPQEWMFGRTNIPINFFTGLLNIIILWGVLFLGFWLVSSYRKINFVKDLKIKKILI